MRKKEDVGPSFKDANLVLGRIKSPVCAVCFNFVPEKRSCAVFGEIPEKYRTMKSYDCPHTILNKEHSLYRWVEPELKKVAEIKNKD